ncbi:MAG TPA: hypothetical protein PK095_06640 [Myxococcota bacterium]|nr:hypothetical protein [Myxococcota bacterium]
MILTGCADRQLRLDAARQLDCPESKVQVTIDANTARAEGCGGLVLFDRVCQTQTHYESGKTEITPGKSVQQCGYEGFGTSRGYRCRSVYQPGTTTYTPAKMHSQSVCNWVSRPERWRREREASSPTAAGADWEKQYRPSAATAKPSPTPSTPSPTAPETKPQTRVAIGALDDLAKAEAVMRRWIGKVVKVALATGGSHEGVLQYVRSYSIWFVDGTTLRLEDVLVAEVAEIAPPDAPNP